MLKHFRKICYLQLIYAGPCSVLGEHQAVSGGRIFITDPATNKLCDVVLVKTLV